MAQTSGRHRGKEKTSPTNAFPLKSEHGNLPTLQTSGRAQKPEIRAENGDHSKHPKPSQVEMGIKNMEYIDDDTVLQTVEILKRPGQTLGFYIREGNGSDRKTGVFISRIADGSVIESNGLLRIGDEILSVNDVDVTRMSLDDVVILVSIPKTLVLNVRTCRPYLKSASSQNLECEETPVILRRGKSSEQNSSDEFLKDLNPDDSNDSGLSSENSVPLSKSDELACGSEQTQSSDSTLKTGDSCDVVTPDNADLEFYGYPSQRNPRVNGIPYGNENVNSSGGIVPQKALPENFMPRYRGQQLANFASNRHGDNLQRSRRDQFPPGYNRQHELYSNSRKPRRTVSPDCYNSDSELVQGYPHRSDGRPDPVSYSSDVPPDFFDDDVDSWDSVPKFDTQEGTEEMQSWLRKFDRLATDLHYDQTVQSRRPPGMTRQVSAPSSQFQQYSPRDPYPSPDSFWSWRGEPLAPPGAQYRSWGTMSKRPSPMSNYDAMLDSRMRQMQDPYDMAQEQRYSTWLHTVAHGPRLNQSQSPSARQVMRDPRDLRDRDLQLTRTPLRIKVEDFELYRPLLDKQRSGKKKSVEALFNGLLSVHVYCGHGLKSSRTALRDLYCVLEIDGQNKARTMIRTGAINFDWDESFELDLVSASQLSTLIYAWDPYYRHRLCFSATVDMTSILKSGKRRKIAVKLEPKGVLYLTLTYKETTTPPKSSPLSSPRISTLFGVALETVLKNENSGLRVPLLVKKCVEEIDHRGLDTVGIYRLCGSAKRKAQLREEFEHNPWNADVSPSNVPDISVVTGLLKDYLRELPVPLFNTELYEVVYVAIESGENQETGSLMFKVLECLPKSHQDTLVMLLDHLKRVALNSDVNKMTTQNISVCFGPVLLYTSPESPTDMKSANDFKRHLEVLEFLLKVWPENRDWRRRMSGAIGRKASPQRAENGERISHC